MHVLKNQHIKTSTPRLLAISEISWKCRSLATMLSIIFSIKKFCHHIPEKLFNYITSGIQTMLCNNKDLKTKTSIRTY